MNHYEEKRQARIERLNQAADKAEESANEKYETASKMAERIPPGQPIHVGHHSEQRDRNYRNKTHNKFEQAYNELQRAANLRARAEAAENNTAISSDDPDAIPKLEKKLEELQDIQEHMKAVNKYYKKNGTCVGCENLSEEEAVQMDEEIKKDYNLDKRPYPSFLLSNNLGNIRNVRERIKELKLRDEMDFEPIEFTGGKVVANKEINRIQIFFDEKPSEEIRAELHARGFHFSRYNNNAWQRQLNRNGLYAANRVMEKIEQINQSEEQGEEPTLEM